MLEFAPDLDAVLRAELGYREARDALLDPRGRTVRCTPTRRTVRWDRPGGGVLFRKHHRGQGASIEWRWLGELRDLGLRVPERLFVARHGADSVVGMGQVEGRPMDSLLTEAAAAGRQAEAASFVLDRVVPLVQRLHAQGLAFRDLYWNHLFTPQLSGPEPALIDLHRVLRPRLRRRRWIVKDLAGLLASLPAGYSHTSSLRFLLRYTNGPIDHHLARAIAAKAHRIRTHRPKYG